MRKAGQPVSLAEAPLSTLLREARQPPALVARADELRAGGPPGWRPSRLVLINYWLFDYEVFHFVQGRLLLRGANGSGKTTVLVSAITLVLDGEKRRERLDTFGGQGRGLAYYLVGDPQATPGSDFYFENRTGYVALELEHGRRGGHLTIGLGLRTSRSRIDQSVDLWGFVVTDGRRVGYDFDLVDPSGQPLTARQLADLLGSGGRVVERASDYQELVNRYLFGFPQVEQYEFVLELLHQLRSPKLNRDIRPTVLCELLSDSLPPLPPGLLDQVTRVIRDIDECTEALEESRRHLQAVQALNLRYAAYLQQTAQLAAVDYQAALAGWRQATARYEQATAALAEAERQLSEERARLEALQLELRELRSRKTALEQHEALQGLEALRWLEGQLRRAQEAEERAARQLERAEAEVGALSSRLQAREREWQQQLQAVREHAARVGGQAAEAAWGAAQQAVEALLQALEQRRAAEPARERLPALARVAPLLSELAAARRAALQAVLRALGEVQRCRVRHQEARLLEQREHEVLYERSQDVERCRAQLEAAREQAAAALEGWLAGLAGVEVRPDEREAALDAVGRYPADGTEPVRLLEPLRPAFDRAARLLSGRLREAQLTCERVAARHDEVARQLDEWRLRQEAEPPRSLQQEEARRRLGEGGIPFLPLFAACELRPGVPAETAGRLEQALAEAGLLDALVVPEGHTGQVARLLGDAGLADRWLAPGTQARVGGGPLAGPALTLEEVLQPDPSLSGQPEWEAAVRAALRSVAWYPEGLTGQAPEGDGAGEVEGLLAVAPGGFRAGPLWGTSAPRPAPAYLGRDNRRRTRDMEVSRLQTELEELERARWEAEAAADRIRGQLELLEAGWRQADALPALRALPEAAYRLELAEEAMRRQEERLQEAARRVQEAFEALEGARAALAEATGPVPETRGLDEDGVRLLLQRADQVVQEARALDGQLAAEERLALACWDAASDRARAAERLDEARKDLQTAREQVADLQGQVSARRQLLDRSGISVEALLAELRQVEARVASAEQEEKERLTRMGALEREVAHGRERVREATEGRARAQEAEEAARAELDRRLRAHPSLQEARALFEAGPDGPARAAEELLKLRRTADDRLRSVVEESRRQAYHQLAAALQEARLVLVDLPPTLEGEQLTFRRRGVVVQPHELESELRDEQVRNQLILQERETQLYEQIILKDAGNEIRNRLEMAYRWRDAINAVLRQHPLVGGERLTLQWRPKPADRATQDDPGRLVELLQRDPETLTDAEFNELVEQFRRRVNDVRRRFQDPHSQVVFSQELAKALDYRQWFRFHLMSAMPGEAARELTDMRFAAGSGGQKSLRMFVPLVAAAYARYQGAAEDAPRLIGLDEAFAGVDEANTREMFGLLDRLGFSWIMTSEKLWGDFPTLPAGSVYELIKEGNVVTPVWFIWDGRRLAGGEQPQDGRDGSP